MDFDKKMAVRILKVVKDTSCGQLAIEDLEGNTSGHLEALGSTFPPIIRSKFVDEVYPEIEYLKFGSGDEEKVHELLSDVINQLENFLRKN